MVKAPGEVHMKIVIQKNYFSSIILIAFLFFSLNNTYARAQNDPTSEIKYIQKTLDEAQGPAALWWYGWITFYSGVASIQFALYKQIDSGKETNQDLIEKKHEFLVGTVKSSLAVIGLLTDPMVPAYAPGRLRGLPADTPENRKIKLSEARILLNKCAKRAEKGRGWIKHILAFVVNTGGSLVLYYKYDSSAKDATINMMTGMLFSEATIFTQPMRAIDDLDQYRKKYEDSQDLAYSDYGRNWFFVPYTGGFGLGLSF